MHHDEDLVVIRLRTQPANACLQAWAAAWAGLQPFIKNKTYIGVRSSHNCPQAVGETVILLHTPLPLVGVSIWMKRG